jgi:hypothetical protein
VIERFFIGPWRPGSAFAYAAAVVALALGVFILGLKITRTTNPNTADFDQGAYIQMAGQLNAAVFPGYTDGTRNPLFPWLVTRFLDPASPDFFARGKAFNVVLGAAGTLLLGLFFAFRLGPLAAWNATALCALAVLLPSSTFFGAETLFYLLFFFVVVCAMRLLTWNPLWLYSLLGLLAALSWLAKPSATPFLALFGGASFLQFLLSRWSGAPAALVSSAWSARRFWIGGALCFALFVGLISPRLVHAHRTWGNPFYSLPSFWFWADDWESCVALYYDCRKETLAKLPPEKQPTAAGYFRRHSLADAFGRLRDGAAIRIGQFFHPEGKRVVEKPGRPRRNILPHRGIYIGALAGLLAVMAAAALVRGGLPDVGPIGLPVLLAAGTFAVYVLATGWYYPTGPGHRFVLTLYLPTVWILAQGGESLRRVAVWRPADVVFLALHGLLAGALAWRLFALFTGAPFEKISYTF